MSDFFRRYERQIDVPEVGVDGQKKLAAASILIIGMGGLGCPSSLYLTAAGIGRIGICDADTVSLSNLQRQILYTENDVGKLKTLAAAEKLLRISSQCRIDVYNEYLTIENAGQIVPEYDLILDCTDNFDTRYLINQLSVSYCKPLVSASVHHHDGQITVFRGYETNQPCYQCLYPRTEKLSLVPQCKEGGILGPVTGILGTMQAAAAINECLQINSFLSGFLLMLSTLDFSTTKLKIFKKPDCVICANPCESIHSFQSGCSI